MPAHTPNTTLVRINARAAADERGVLAAPASLTLRVTGPIEPGVPTRAAALDIVAVSTATDNPPVDVVIERSDAVLVPALVNAHAHLDLTHIGPQPHTPDDGFVAWVDMVREGRVGDDDEIAASVSRGIELSIRGGTAAIGDIAGAPAGVPNLMPFKMLRASGLGGVSYLEFFAIGNREGTARDRISATLDAALADGLFGPDPATSVRLGLQPHAPNTVAIASYLWAAARARAMGMPLCTHLAETPEEIEFIANASGPQREMLERFGFWDDSTHAGRGEHPIAHLRPFLDACEGLSPRPLLVHVNDVGDQFDALATSGASVAYCPRASAYFDAPVRLGPHRYREMLAAGINVCLGTDSVVCLPPDQLTGEHARLSVLDDMRLLRARDAADPALLLSMGTTRAASALGLDPGAFRLDPGPLAGLVAITSTGASSDPLGAALARGAPPEFLYLRNHACQTV